ncbi:hypothetical protein LSTR_LSTR006308 [Laodelphax striatellus]|uniref:Uncharacterized protein n=1 Tax=Laodelphax striatellus TaxID=195883 RepID=A0A482X536_LAOST|nr:hypothetical protein LSTR_LSTR006308 [Laodelphax striatellus]
MTPWLPDNCTIVDDLEKWLGHPAYIRWSKPKLDELENEKANDEVQRSKVTEKLKVVMNEDLGVAISRERFDMGAIALKQKKKRRMEVNM